LANISEGLIGDRGLVADDWSSFFFCSDRKRRQVRIAILDQGVQAKPAERIQ
jgi:hypothetical protein